MVVRGLYSIANAAMIYFSYLPLVTWVGISAPICIASSMRDAMVSSRIAFSRRGSGFQAEQWVDAYSLANGFMAFSKSAAMAASCSV